MAPLLETLGRGSFPHEAELEVGGGPDSDLSNNRAAAPTTRVIIPFVLWYPTHVVVPGVETGTTMFGSGPSAVLTRSKFGPQYEPYLSGVHLSAYDIADTAEGSRDVLLRTPFGNYEARVLNREAYRLLPAVTFPPDPELDDDPRPLDVRSHTVPQYTCYRGDGGAPSAPETWPNELNVRDEFGSRSIDFGRDIVLLCSPALSGEAESGIACSDAAPQMASPATDKLLDLDDSALETRVQLEPEIRACTAVMIEEP